MYSNIIADIRREILRELTKRTAYLGLGYYAFRETDEEGDEKVHCDIAVGFPDENGVFPDVRSVSMICGEVVVSVITGGCDTRVIKANDVELSTQELAYILDAIIDGNAVLVE